MDQRYEGPCCSLPCQSRQETTSNIDLGQDLMHIGEKNKRGGRMRARHREGEWQRDEDHHRRRWTHSISKKVSSRKNDIVWRSANGWMMNVATSRCGTLRGLQEIVCFSRGQGGRKKKNSAPATGALTERRCKQPNHHHGGFCVI
jgi:hypothetical protein